MIRQVDTQTTDNRQGGSCALLFAAGLLFPGKATPINKLVKNENEPKNEMTSQKTTPPERTARFIWHTGLKV